MSGCRTNTKYFTLCLLFLLTTLSNSIDVETPKGNSLPLDVNTVLLNRDEANTFLNKERTRKLLTKRQLKDSKLIHIDRRILWSCGTGQRWVDKVWDECHNCGAGRYQDQNEHWASSCKGCQPGRVSSSGSSGCLDCSPGTYQNPEKDGCYSCDPGQYSSSGSSGCSDCMSGTFTAYYGSSGCTDCPQGTYQKPGEHDVCHYCEAGQYQPYPAKQSCLECETGKRTGGWSIGYRYPAKASCDFCPQGWSFTSYNEECERCTAGKYQPSNDVPSASCQDCPVGKRSSEQSSSCDDCQLGRIQPLEGKESCSDCEKGKKYISAGVACVNCVEGTFSQQETQIWYDSGGQGWYVPVLVCSDCDVGTYSDQPATFPSCTSCISGKYG